MMQEIEITDFITVISILQQYFNFFKLIIRDVIRDINQILKFNFITSS